MNGLQTSDKEKKAANIRGVQREPRQRRYPVPTHRLLKAIEGYETLSHSEMGLQLKKTADHVINIRTNRSLSIDELMPRFRRQGTVAILREGLDKQQ